MLQNGKIDLIIPVYNVKKDLLFNCLSSVANQSLKDILTLTIVDDASTNTEYEEVIDVFSKVLDIKVLKLEKNGGPGVARQYGLDNTSNEFVCFLDADDLLSSGFSLHYLKQLLDSNKNFEMVIGAFQEMIFYNNMLTSVTHTEDFVWVFGKMYRRSFLNRFNIRFHETSRANEDTGFNTLCKIYLQNSRELIGFTDEVVYYWYPSENSITRKNNCEYSTSTAKDACFYGYVENMIYASETANKNKELKDKSFLIAWSLSVMVKMYFSYLDLKAKNKEDGADKGLEYCAEYYKKIFLKFRPFATDEEFLEIYNIECVYHTSPYCELPDITFLQFLNLLEEKIK